MESAHIVLVEDESAIQQMLVKSLTREGHIIDLIIGSVAEVPEAFEEIDPNTVDISVVDANLARGHRGGDDGAQVVQLIQQVDSDIYNVGFCSPPDRVRGAIAQVEKPNFKELLKVIGLLPRRRASH